RVEQIVPPRKGTRHAQRLLRDILFYRPAHRGTDLKVALDTLQRVQRLRGGVFLLHDFRAARLLRVRGGGRAPAPASGACVWPVASTTSSPSASATRSTTNCPT